MKKIVFIAGDRSGDLYGGLVCKKLKEKFPSLQLYSFGGDNLASSSTQVVDLLSHSVSGLIEVIGSLKQIFKIFNNIVKKIDEINPDLIIPIDFPDFNLRLLKKLNKRYPVFYYISPQVWAWRKKRVKTLREYVDKMVVIFKFEEEFYRQNNVDSLYFGHPLLDIISGKTTKTENIISFLPGSRKNEVAMHLKTMMGARDILAKKFPEYAFQIIRPKNLDKSLYREFSKKAAIVPYSHETLEKSKFIITACGTATVEIAILGVPYLIVYKVNPLTWWLLKRLVRTEFAGMINILRGKEIVKELLQSKATPEKIAGQSSLYLENSHLYAQLKNELSKSKELLGPHGASEKFADFIINFLHSSPGQVRPK
jgi:lipid-A-disaccharide synthase